MSIEVAAIGRINVDLSLNVESLPAPGDHIFSTHSSVSFGGSAANFSRQLAKLGVEVALYAYVGDDMFGKAAAKSLSDSGVDTEGVLILENQPTGLFCNIKGQNGQQIIIANQGANRLLEKHVLDEDYLTQAKTVHVAGGFPMIAKRATELATTEGMIFSFDPGRAASDIDFSTILRSTDLLFLNRRELKQYFGIKPSERELRKIAKTFPGIVVVKMGEEGAIATDGFQYCTSRIFEVTVADTLGAGDAFAAGFVTAWTRSEDIEQALHFANAVAAQAIAEDGAQNGQPTLDETAQFLRDYGIYIDDILRTFKGKGRRRRSRK